MLDKPQRVGIYCRLSYAEDGTEEKVDRQEEDCRELGDRLAWPISEAHIFKDNSRSAWKRNRKRPAWDRMLRAIDDGEIDGLLIYHGDRLIRQPFDLELLISRGDQKGIRIASPQGQRNLDNPDDRYILRIEAAGFCRSSDDTSRRVKRGYLAKRISKGLPGGGGTRPFGFERDNTTIRPAEAELIPECAERLLAGQKTYSIIRWLISIGSRTSAGNQWTGGKFKRMMMRPRNAGFITHNGDLLKAVWEPILDEETWIDVCQLLEERGGGQGLDNKVRYLLSGIAKCTCDAGLSRRLIKARKRRPYPVYFCMNLECAHRVTISLENLDAYVQGRVVQLLNDPAFMAELIVEKDRPGLAAEIAAYERRKEQAEQQLKSLADHPSLRPDLLLDALESFDRRINELRTVRAGSTRRRQLAKMAGVSREKWESEPLDVKRATIGSLFTIAIKPAEPGVAGFNVSRVDMRRQSLDE